MKEYVNYQLVHIDFENDKYNFSNISVSKLNQETIQVVSHSGKLGNNGKRTVLLEVSNDYQNLQNAIKKAKEHMKEKKKLGFVFKKDIEDKLKNMYKTESRCDVCGDFIKEDLYEKINTYARSDGGWDKDKKCIGYQKVLCIPCQMEHKLFKKRKQKKEK